jgi:EthD domain
MIKLLSVKTRRPGSTREAFRQHYEGRHIPLGLGFIDRFRWCKYVRNHVVAVHAGQVDFDCLTEFWFASREDQDSTRAFAASPAFRVLDEDDERFLDVNRRLSFELEERLVVGVRPARDAAGTRRVAAIFSRPESIGAEAFERSISAELGRIASRVDPAVTRVALDLRALPGPRPTEFAAIVSTWSPPGALPVRLSGWLDCEPDAEVELDVVETPADRLWSPT